MRTATRFFPVLLAVTLLLTPAVAVAQPEQPAPAQKPIEIPVTGFELFRALLDRAGITPVTLQDLTQRRIDWSGVIVIAVGDQSRWVNTDPLEYAHYAREHDGAVLIAADTATNLGLAPLDRGFGQTSGRIEGVRVECKNPTAVHAVKIGDVSEPQLDCPYIVPLTNRDTPHAPDDDVPISKVFAGLTRVATNKPSYLHVGDFSGPFRFALAGFPRRSVIVDPNRFGNRGEQLPADALFAVGGEAENNPWSGYRFLAMADHSVFINQMLLEPGTQNLELAYRVIEYLQGPSKRKRCLFSENGKIIEKFDDLRQAYKKAKPPPPLPDLTKVIDMGNQLIDKLQQSNALNNLVLGPANDPEKQSERLAGIAKVLLVLVAIYATWYLMRRTFGARKPTDLPPPPAVAGAPTGPPGVFDRRQKELMRRDNLYEPVRDLIREFFASVGIHGTDQGPRHPKLAISDAVRRPESLRLAIKDFWKLAYGPPQEVGMTRWREMEPYFDRLRQAHADGKWHFVLADAPVAASV